MASLRAFFSSFGRLSLTSQNSLNKSILTPTCSAMPNILTSDQRSGCANVQVRLMSRMHFPGLKRNSPEFYHIMRERRHFHPDWWKMIRTRTRKCPGHIDLYNKKGEREPLQAAVERFKRLDWGTYVRVMIGRRNKKFRKTPYQLWREEQHVFAWKDFVPKLDRMFTGDLKRKRYFIDDPFEKYNRMSYDKYHNSLLKNSQLIEDHGNKMYKFDRWRAHNDMYGSFNHLAKERYAPPGYLKTIADNGGAYKPEGDNVIPEPEWMAPHFQRHANRRPDFLDLRKNFFVKGKGYFVDKWISNIRKFERYGGDLPSFSRTLVRRGSKPVV